MCTSPDGTFHFDLSVPPSLANLPRDCKTCGVPAVAWWSAPGGEPEFCCGNCSPFAPWKAAMALPWGMTYVSLPLPAITHTVSHLGTARNGCTCGSGWPTVCPSHAHAVPVTMSTSGGMLA